MNNKILLTILIIVLTVTVAWLYSSWPKSQSDSGQPYTNTEKAEIGDVRQVVWNQLTSEQKEMIEGGWQEAEISEVTLTEVMMIGVEDKSYGGSQAYMIDFATKDLNGLPALVDIKTNQLIGFGPVD